MESMKRVDVLKGIEQILVQKAYETGHISHRSDGDWQKQADGSWIPVKGGSASAPATKETPTNNEPQPDQDNSAEWEEYASRMLGLSDQKAEEDPAGYGYEEPPAEVDVDNFSEETKFDSDAEEKNFLKEEYGIDVADYKDSDTQAIRHDLSTTYGMSGSQLDYVADLIVNNLPEDDEPSDDEIYDYEDDLANEEDKFNQYKISHPRPALSNDGHSKGLTSEKDMFEDAIERFRELTDPYNDERLTAGEAIKQMKEEMEYGKGIDPESYTPAIESGFKKFSDWIADFEGVEKSIRKVDIHAPAVKNMGF